MADNEVGLDTMTVRHRQYGESVLFALSCKGQILCEWREWPEGMMNSIPGGKVDPADRERDDYLAAALVREMGEEFGVRPTDYRFVGDIWYGKEWVFHVYIVESWDGNVPTRSLEGNRRLNWISPGELQDNGYMPGIASLMQEVITREPNQTLHGD